MSILPQQCAWKKSGVQQDVFVRLCNSRQRSMLCVTVLLLALSWLYFWAFWVFHVHQGKWHTWTLADCLVSVVWAIQTFDTMLAYTVLLGAQTPNMRAPVPRFRAALIVTKAPSEPAELLQTTLTAMLWQNYPYPYDVWIADECPTPEMKAWCAEQGVKISSRFGVKEYHQPKWPRRTKCKEGNLSYFYDHWGYQDYDVVCQFDADHVPDPSYLSTCLLAFRDPSIGYVACPSVNSAGAKHSWAARGRLYYEAVFHGAGQAAWFPGWMPCCIGSHYAVRSSYLKEIGGIGPELDEDWSTSYLFTARGFKGAFSINTNAIGEGPATFDDCMHQEYQWARSFIILALNYVLPFWRSSMGVREKFRICSCIFYYVWHGCYPVYVLGLSLLPCFGLQYGPCTWGEVLLHYNLPLFVSMVHCSWLRSAGWLRPANAPIMAWESAIHQYVRLFWILKGMLHAVIGHVTGFQFKIAVTPKGDDGAKPLKYDAVWPLLAVSVLCSSITWSRAADIHLPFAFGFLNLVLAFVIFFLHHREQYGSNIPARAFFVHLIPLVLVLGFQLVVLLHRGTTIWTLLQQSMSILHREESLWNDEPALIGAWIICVGFVLLHGTSSSHRYWFHAAK